MSVCTAFAYWDSRPTKPTSYVQSYGSGARSHFHFLTASIPDTFLSCCLTDTDININTHTDTQTETHTHTSLFLSAQRYWTHIHWNLVMFFTLSYRTWASSFHAEFKPTHWSISEQSSRVNNSVNIAHLTANIITQVRVFNFCTSHPNQYNYLFVLEQYAMCLFCYRNAFLYS